MSKYTMDYTKGHGAGLKRAQTPMQEGYSPLEATLTRFNILRYNAGGQFDAGLSNRDRLDFAAQHLPPIIIQGEALYYRHLRKGERGLWQAEYLVKRPSILAPIAEDESVSKEAASAFLQIHADKLDIMAGKHAIRRNKKRQFYFNDLLQFEPVKP